MTEPVPARWTEDAARLARIAAGDERAFLVLFEAQHPRLVRLATGVVGDVEDAREIASDALFALWRHAPDWEPRGRLDTWLYRVVVRRALSTRRRLVRAARHALLPTGAPSPARAFDVKDASRALRAAIARLPGRDRAILALVLDQDLDPQELSVVLDLTPNAARVALHRALGRLRSHVDADLRASLIPGRDDAWALVEGSSDG